MARKSSKSERGAKIVLVLGPSGVGKTAVMTRALEGRKDVKVVNFGHITQEVVGGDRDKFRREATLSDARKMQVKVAKKLSAMAKREKGGLFIVTSHSVMFKSGGFWPGFPRWVMDELDLSMIVLVSGIPEEIAARKSADNLAGKTEGRTRDEIPLETILAEQDVGRGVAYAYSMYSGAIVKEIVNRQGKLDGAAEELRNCLRAL